MRLGWVHFRCRFQPGGWVPFTRRLPIVDHTIAFVDPAIAFAASRARHKVHASMIIETAAHQLRGKLPIRRIFPTGGGNQIRHGNKMLKPGTQHGIVKAAELIDDDL
jgi:hypothetical protein